MAPISGPSGTDQDLASDRTLVTSRVIAAPPEQVYAARLEVELARTSP